MKEESSSFNTTKRESTLEAEVTLIKAGLISPRPSGLEADPNGKNPHELGAKVDAGKTRVWLCVAGFSRALEEVAKITTVGANKYTPNGWCYVEGGIDRYMDAFGRHMLSLGSGEVYDNGPGGTGGMHKAQMIWNLLASLELELREKECQKKNVRKKNVRKQPKNFS